MTQDQATNAMIAIYNAIQNAAQEHGMVCEGGEGMTYKNGFIFIDIHVMTDPIIEEQEKRDRR